MPQTTLAAALNKAGSVLAQSSADTSANQDLAALYALFVGWECEQDHEHDAADEDSDCRSSLHAVAADFGWTPRQVQEVRAMRTAIRIATEYADPSHRRGCEWPGCTHQYNAAAVMAGLAEAPGWTQARGFWGGLRLCPAHASTGHAPHAVSALGQAPAIGCRCGAAADLSAPNPWLALGWWRGHVAELDLVGLPSTC